MSVVEAVDRDLGLLGGDLADTALAATARVLAAQLDSPGVSATAKSMCAARLQEVMDRLRELAPPRKENDAVDEVERKRVARRRAAGVSAAADLPRS